MRPPDLEFNPVSGYVESVDIDSDSNDRVRYVEDEGQGERGSATLVPAASAAASAADPRIAIDTNSDTWVVSTTNSAGSAKHKEEGA